MDVEKGCCVEGKKWMQQSKVTSILHPLCIWYVVGRGGWFKKICGPSIVYIITHFRNLSKSNVYSYRILGYMHTYVHV